MVVMNVGVIVLAPIIMLAIHTKPALVSKGVLAYKAFCTVQVRGIILVGTIEGFIICKFLQLDYYLGVLLVL